MTFEETLRRIVREEIAAALEPLMKPRAEPAVLDTEEAATLLKLPVDTIRKKAAKGEIPSFKMGILVRFRRAELEA